MAKNSDYQKRDLNFVDYDLWHCPDSIKKTDFFLRGPEPDLNKPYFVCLGAASTFGCYVENPYPSLLSKKLNLPVLNLGISGAGATFYLEHPGLLELAQKAEFAIIAATSGRSHPTSLFQPPGLGKKTGPQILQELKALFNTDQEKFKQILAEMRASFIRDNIKLAESLPIPKIFIYLAKKSPDYQDQKLLQKKSYNVWNFFPHFINRPTLDAIQDSFDHYIECVSSEGLPQQLIDRFTGKPPVTEEKGQGKTFNNYYASPEMHQEAFNLLLPVAEKYAVKSASIIEDYQETMAILKQQKTKAEYLKLANQLIKNNYFQDAENLLNQLKKVYPQDQKIRQIFKKLKPQKSPQNQKTFLFVSGNPRSGTTALGQLLNLSEDILLGVERYTKKTIYHPSLFEFDTFFNENDRQFQARRDIYDSLKPRFATCKYIGDKRPNFLLPWQKSKDNFSSENIRIIHIIRNVHNIAFSYNQRAERADANIDQSWNPHRDYKLAVEEFNRNLKLLAQLINSQELKDNLLIIRYEDIYSSSDLMKGLFCWLNIDITPKLHRDIEQFALKSLKVINKERTLSQEEISYLDSSLDQETLFFLDGICEQHLSLLS